MRPGPPLRDMGRSFYRFWYFYIAVAIILAIFAIYHGIYT